MTEEMPSEVLVRDEGAVRVLTMNRPDKLNALNFALTRALLEALRAAEADEAIGCIVLTGAGRGFCAGADVSEFAHLTGDNTALVKERAQLTASLHGIFPQLRKPVIGAVNGFAMGGGAGLALACDMVVAAASARFGYPEVKHGIVPAIVMANLVRVVGRKKAFELVSTARTVQAEEALALGMVNSIVADEDLLPAALSLADNVAQFSRPAMEMTKSLFYRAADLPFAEALAEGQTANEKMRKLRTA